MAKLWALDAAEPVGELKGHAGRLSRVAFHPSGRYVGDTSYPYPYPYPSPFP